MVSAKGVKRWLVLASCSDTGVCRPLSPDSMAAKISSDWSSRAWTIYMNAFLPIYLGLTTIGKCQLFRNFASRIEWEANNKNPGWSVARAIDVHLSHPSHPAEAELFHKVPKDKTSGRTWSHPVLVVCGQQSDGLLTLAGDQGQGGLAQI